MRMITLETGLRLAVVIACLASTARGQSAKDNAAPLLDELARQKAARTEHVDQPFTPQQERASYDNRLAAAAADIRRTAWAIEAKKAELAEMELRARQIEEQIAAADREIESLGQQSQELMERLRPVEADAQPAAEENTYLEQLLQLMDPTAVAEQAVAQPLQTGGTDASPFPSFFETGNTFDSQR